MGMFDLSATTGVKESGNFLRPGIYNAKFKSVELSTVTSQKDSKTYNTMKLTLDLDGFGEWSTNFFEPTSDERTEGTYGQNPSQAEHFLVSVRQIIDALDPAIGESIDNDNVVVNNKKVSTKNFSFTQLVKLINVLTKPYEGTELEVKLIPQSNGFASIPGFPAKVNKAGALGISTRFIGHNLVMNQSEQRKIDAMKDSKPTNMAQTSTGSVDGLADALGINNEDSSDLPF